MSDPYAPYQAPSAYPDYQSSSPPPSGNRPATIAAMLLLGLVALYIVQAVLSIYYYATAPVTDFVPPRSRDQLADAGMGLETIRTMYTVGIGACMGIIVLLLLVLVPFVKKGGRGATITAIVVGGLLGLFAIFGVLGNVIQLSGAMAGPDMPNLPAWVVVSSLILSVLVLLDIVLLIVFLAKSLGERTRQMQAQAQSYMAGQQAAWQGYYQQPPPLTAPPSPPPQNWGGPQER